MEKEIKKRAMWIGKATTLANNLPKFPFKDTEVARWKADKTKKTKGEQGGERKTKA